MLGVVDNSPFYGTGCTIILSGVLVLGGVASLGVMGHSSSALHLESRSMILSLIFLTFYLYLLTLLTLL